MKSACIGVSMVLLLAGYLGAQKPRTREDGLVMPLVLMRGTLREIDKKEILLDTGEDRVVSLRISKKTKFFKGAKTIPEGDLKSGSEIVIEASREVNGDFSAVNVYLGEPPAGRK